ncbi:unnamed protein product, partial [Caenorhabditis brenneri]
EENAPMTIVVYMNTVIPKIDLTLLTVMNLTKKMNTQIMGTEHATIVETVLGHKYAANTIIVIMVIVNSTKTVNAPKKISTENPPSTSNASRDVLMTLAAQMVILAFSDAVPVTFGGSETMENKFIWLNFLK